MTDTLQAHDHIYLDRLRLAADVLIRAGEEETDVVNSALESELHLLKARIERALLGPDAP